MIETVYIETSILGHLTARPTDNLIVAANIKITRDWWDQSRQFFVLYASQIVEDEAKQGDPVIASQRLDLLKTLMLLEVREVIFDLAQIFLEQSNLPSKASVDALHMAIATVYELDYLLTWNCKHMANA